MNPATRSRSPEPPFCWQSKEALRKIREHFDGDSLLPYALSVYCALTENASNKGEEEFTTLQSHLTQLSGVSVRTIQRVLPDLRQLGVIDYITPKLRGPITFTLLSVRTPCPHVTSNRRNVPPTTKSTSQADNRNNKRRTREEQKKNTPIPPHDCVEGVCEFSPGSNGSKAGNIPLAAKADRGEPAATVESVAAKAAGGEAPPARACRAREKPAAEGRAGGFAEFWKAYPRKVGKLAAERVWKQRRPPLSKVLTALEAWRNSPEWLKDGGRYIPHPAT